MVTGWLKRRLISDFFEVLTADGDTDKRRLNYWLQYENVIEDLWLILGPDAAHSRRPAFEEIRERAVGRTMYLTSGGQPGNNAFAMKIGGFWIIEFGQTGNACFVYREDALPAKFKDRASVGTSMLKMPALAVERLLHMDSAWESNFSYTLRQYGIRPDQTLTSSKQTSAARVTPSRYPVTFRASTPKSRVRSEPDMAALAALQKREYFHFKDLRRDGGAFWIQGLLATTKLGPELERLGFQRKVGRGWWFKDKP